MVGAAVRGLENPVAVAVEACPALAPADPARGLRAAHRAAGALHGREERRLRGLAELGVHFEEDGRRVHLPLARPASERETLREREEARRRLVAEPARAEVDAHPDTALLVLHEVHVVVAGADRAELRLGELRQLPLRAEARPTDAVENGVVDPLRGRHAHAERDAAGDLPP